jgi:high-affinity Fe2+/Pb2+ permease
MKQWVDQHMNWLLAGFVVLVVAMAGVGIAGVGTALVLIVAGGLLLLIAGGLVVGGVRGFVRRDDNGGSER